MKCTHVARLKQLTNSSPNTCLADELAEQRPDMNIKVTPFTVSEKSINGQAILVRKSNIHAYSMYVLFADKVSCPMT